MQGGGFLEVWAKKLYPFPIFSLQDKIASILVKRDIQGR